MALLTAFTPVVAGVANAGAAVAASDTIDAATLGSRGVFLEIINGNASTDNMTIQDFGTTAAGNSLPSSNTYAVSVTNATSKIFLIRPSQVNASGVVTITHSVTATVTYKLYILATV